MAQLWNDRFVPETKPDTFPVKSLSGWCKRYGTEAHGLNLGDVEGRGNGWNAEEDVKSDGEDGRHSRNF